MARWASSREAARSHRSAARSARSASWSSRSSSSVTSCSGVYVKLLVGGLSQEALGWCAGCSVSRGGVDISAVSNPVWSLHNLFYLGSFPFVVLRGISTNLHKHAGLTRCPRMCERTAPTLAHTSPKSRKTPGFGARVAPALLPSWPPTRFPAPFLLGAPNPPLAPLPTFPALRARPVAEQSSTTSSTCSPADYSRMVCSSCTHNPPTAPPPSSAHSGALMVVVLLLAQRGDDAQQQLLPHY